MTLIEVIEMYAYIIRNNCIEDAKQFLIDINTNENVIEAIINTVDTKGHYIRNSQ